MSAVAECYVVPKDSLAAVRDAVQPRRRLLGKPEDRFYEVLERESERRHEYAWDGFTLATLLPYLDERGIALMDSPHADLASYVVQTRQVTCFVLTSEHRDRYAGDLDPDRFSTDELRRYYEDFTETEAPGAEDAMRDGIAFFRDILRDLDETKVGVLVVG